MDEPLTLPRNAARCNTAQPSATDGRATRGRLQYSRPPPAGRPQSACAHPLSWADVAGPRVPEWRAFYCAQRFCFALPCALRFAQHRTARPSAGRFRKMCLFQVACCMRLDVACCISPLAERRLLREDVPRCPRRALLLCKLHKRLSSRMARTMRARTHARTDMRTRTDMHTRTHTRACARALPRARAGGDPLHESTAARRER